MKYLLFPFVFILLFSCDSSESEPFEELEPFKVVVDLNTSILNGHIKDDEEVEISFVVFDSADIFSNLMIEWQYTSNDTIQEVIEVQIDKARFQTSGDSLIFHYLIPEEEFYSLFFANVDSISVFNNDYFTFQWTVFDGTGMILQNAIATSLIQIKCMVNESFFIGDYLLESEVICTSFSGCTETNTTIEEGPITILRGENPLSRVLPSTFFKFDVMIELDLICGSVIIPEQHIDISCTDGIIIKNAMINTLDYSDDSIIKLDFIFDINNDCGVTYEESITLTKIE